MMSGTMANKGRKPGKGVDDNKLADALRRAEEAVLRDGKERDEEAKKEKEPKSSPPVELDDSHFAKKQPEPQPEKKPEKKASKGLDLDSVLFGDKPKKKPAAKPAATPAAKPAEPPKQQPAPPMVDLSKKEEPAPKKPAAPAKKLPDRPPPNLGFGELDLGGGSAESSEMELSAMSEDPIERPTAPTPSKAPTAPPPVERPSDSRLPMRDPSKEYVPYVPKRSYGRQIKIFLLVVLILAAIGGGVYGFIKWRESVAAAEAAEKAKIESSSRDSLMDDTFKKEKFK
jgi:hypothetical protein